MLVSKLIWVLLDESAVMLGRSELVVMLGYELVDGALLDESAVMLGRSELVVMLGYELVDGVLQC